MTYHPRTDAEARAMQHARLGRLRSYRVCWSRTGKLWFSPHQSRRPFEPFGYPLFRVACSRPAKCPTQVQGWHAVEIHPGQDVCTCEGWRFRGICKHIGAVLRRRDFTRPASSDRGRLTSGSPLEAWR